MKHNLRRFTATLTAAATALAVVGLATVASNEVVTPAQAETISTSGTYTSGPDKDKPWEVTSLYEGNTISPEDFTWNLGPTQPIETLEMAQRAVAAQAVGGAAASSTQYTVYVLRGDTMTWTGAVSFGQSLASAYFGEYTPKIEGIWAPDYGLGYYGFNSIAGDYFYGVDELNPKNMENITIDDSDPKHIPICPDDPLPSVGRTHPTVLWDGWCWGILSFTATIDSAHVAPPTVDMVIPGKTWTYGSLRELTTLGGATTWGGPNNPAMGDNVEGYGVLSILDPKLEVKKQVCTNYDSQGNPTCTNESSNGWVDDETFGDPDDPSMPGLPGGVKDGVEEGQVPPGTTNLMWRITASNAGNVPLTGIHVAADATTFDPAVIDDPIDRTNVDACDGMKFTSTYDSNGNPRVDVLHDFARYGGDETFSEPGVLMPGNQISQVCTTVMDHAFTGTVQNTVGLNALFDDPENPIFQQPEGFEWNSDGTLRLGGPLNNQPVYPDVHTALMYRFTGYNGEVGQVPSNTDSAQVTIPNPMIKLTKWVCTLYDDNKNPVCDPKVLTQGSDTLLRMAGIGTVPNRTDQPVDMTPNSDGTYPVTQGLAPDGSGWAKVTTVPYEASGLWLLIVTNVGNVPVTNIDFSTEYLTGKAGQSDDWQHVPIDDPAILMPGASAKYTVLTHAIIDTDTQQGSYFPPTSYDNTKPNCQDFADKLVTGGDGAPTSHCTIYEPYGEYPWKAGDDVVNTAIATADALNLDQTPMKDTDGNQVSVISNPSTAEANTYVPSGALKVTKWVCSIGTGCSYSLTHAQLQQLTGVSVMPTDIEQDKGQLDVVQGQSVSGVTADGVEWSWLPETYVGYSADADWLVVATNIGDVSLVGLGYDDMPAGPSVSYTGVRMQQSFVADETTANRANTSTRMLASGNSVAWRVSMTGITSRAQNDPGYDSTTNNANTPWNEPDRLSGTGSVVNTASAYGTAWDVVNDEPLPNPVSGATLWTVTSNTSSAEVNSLALAIGDWVWFDSNEDGLQGDTPDNAVSGIQGVQVDLLHADGTPVLNSTGKPMTTKTDSEGFYYFDMLSPGTYRVAFHLPAGYAWTVPWAKTGGQDEDPTYVYVARDSNAAFAYSSPASVATLTNDSPASEDPTDLIRVTRAFDMSLPILLDSANYDYVFPTSQAAIPDRYKATLRADYINPTIDAGVIYPNPELKITKWVCERYNALNQPDCSDPYSINPDSGKVVWDDLNGYTAQKHELYTGVPAGGWVKEATIPAGATAQWLIVVTNVGGTRLANVSLSDTLEGSPADPANGRGATGTAYIYDPDEGLTDRTSVDILQMTDTAVFMMTTENITNKNLTVSGIKYGIDDENNDPKNAAVGEPTYADGTDDVINTVTAQGDPVNQALEPVMSDDGVTPLPPEISNTSTAEVNALGYAIGDYVWIDENRDGIQDETESPLEGVTVTLYRTVTDANGVQTLVQVGTRTTDDKGFYLFDNLGKGTYQVKFTVPGGYVWTKTGAGTDLTDSDADQVTGLSGPITLGSDGDGNPVPGLVEPSDALGYAVDAAWINPSVDAGVYLPEPGIKITKWVCTDFDTGCADPTGDDLKAMAGYNTTDGMIAGEPRIGWAKETLVPDETTEVRWLMVVTNTGKETLTDVKVQDAYSKGNGAAEPICRDIEIVRTLVPGASALYHCSTASVTNVNPFVEGTLGDAVTFGEPTYATGEDVVNAAWATGTPTDATGAIIPSVDDKGQPVVDKDGKPVPVTVESNVSEAEAGVVSYAVGDYVWFDTNGDGIQNNAEKGAAGVIVNLKQGATVVDTTTTDENGWYHFDMLNSGQYTIEFILPNGYLWTKSVQGPDRGTDSDADYTNDYQVSASSAAFTLGQGASGLIPASDAPDAYTVQAQYINPTLDAGLIEANPGIALTKYVCTTGTGCDTPTDYTSLDAPNSSWVDATTVTYNTSADWLVLIQNTGNMVLTDVNLDQEDFSAGGQGFTMNDCVKPIDSVTDSLGLGEIVGWTCRINNVKNTEALESGKDIVNTAVAIGTPVYGNGGVLRHPDGTVQTVRSEPDSAEVNTELYAVGDYVWIDSNGDGRQGSEKGLAGVTVRLLDKDGNPVHGVAAVTTNEQGYYVFDMLPPGEYMVEFTLPDGYLWTQSGQGTDRGADSDATFTSNSQATAVSGVVTLGKDADGMIPAGQAPDAYTVGAISINPTIDAGLIEAQPGIALAKYVCASGTRCDTPADFTSLDAPNSSWVKAATVTYNTSADWLVLIQNTGDVPLANVGLTREDFQAGGLGFEVNDCVRPAGSIIESLGVGEVTSWTCTVNSVTNTEAWGSDKDIVNTAAAVGTPIYGSGHPLYNSNGTPKTIPSNPDTAEVNTLPKTSEPTTPPPSEPTTPPPSEPTTPPPSEPTTPPPSEPSTPPPTEPSTPPPSEPVTPPPSSPVTPTPSPSTPVPAVDTGGTAQPPSQGWAIPLFLIGTMIGVGALVARKRFN